MRVRGQSLNFDSFNYQKIESGKRTTIRYGLKPLHLGSCVLKQNEVDKSSVFIEELRAVKYSELTYDLAYQDGFESLKELQKDLSRLYGREFGDNDLLTVVKFS